MRWRKKLVTADRYLSENKKRCLHNYSIGHRNYEISRKGGEIVYKASSKGIDEIISLSTRRNNRTDRLIKIG
ncbi:MAG: hypothetical protein ACLR7D_03780 [Lachnospira eligens]